MSRAQGYLRVAQDIDRDRASLVQRLGLQCDLRGYPIPNEANIMAIIEDSPEWRPGYDEWSGRIMLGDAEFTDARQTELLAWLQQSVMPLAKAPIVKRALRAVAARHPQQGDDCSAFADLVDGEWRTTAARVAHRVFDLTRPSRVDDYRAASALRRAGWYQRGVMEFGYQHVYWVRSAKLVGNNEKRDEFLQRECDKREQVVYAQRAATWAASRTRSVLTARSPKIATK